MEGYIHFYEENTSFDADYNTPEYYEPWLSYTYDARRTDYNKRNRAEETRLWLDGCGPLTRVISSSTATKRKK